MKIRSTICLQHDEIMGQLNQIFKTNKDEKISRRIERAMLHVEAARQMGQRMEQRLQVYREGIQALGFTRKRSQKK